MSGLQPLCLPNRFESSHPSLSDPGRFIPDKAGQVLLVNSPPEIMLLGIDFDEDPIDIEVAAETSVLSFQTTGAKSAKLDTQKAD